MSWLLTAVLLLGWLALQAWLLPARWINPDEGAHLMDARLAMQGLLPMADYDSRQPFYVYTYVPFLALFGPSVVSGRLMPLVAMVLGAFVVGAIGRRLWGALIGWLAAVFYLAAPTTIVNAGVVKMEPLANVWTALGMYGLIVHVQEKRWGPLVLSGMAMAAAYYVRESTLAGLLAALVLIGATARAGVAGALRRLGIFLLGYGAVCGAVAAIYATRLGLGRVLMDDSLFPFAMAFEGAAHILRWLGHHASPSGVEAAVRFSAQSVEFTFRNLSDALRLNVFFLAGAAVAAALGCQRWWSRRRSEKDRTDLWGLAVAFVWLGSFVLLYAYHIIGRGFFQFYFREFIPSLSLLLAFALRELLKGCGWETSTLRAVLAGLLACGASYLFQRAGQGGGLLLCLAAVGGVGWAVFRADMPSAARRLWYSIGWAGLMALVAVARFAGSEGSWPRLPAVWWLAIGTGAALALGRATAGRAIWPRAFHFVALAAVAASGLSAASYAAGALSPSYDCVWSPGTLRRAAEAVRRHSSPGDEVMSGAVAWEFEAGREPFARISHPLGFLDRMDHETVQFIAERFAVHPPQLIVLDGYTERTYLKGSTAANAALETSYRLAEEIPGSKYPVKVYVRRELSLAQHPAEGSHERP